MGKGGTKFESEAIGVRSGRQKTGVSLKDVKKNMEVCSSAVQASLTGGYLKKLTPMSENLYIIADLQKDRKTPSFGRCWRACLTNTASPGSKSPSCFSQFCLWQD